jgi:hypothetical protein
MSELPSENRASSAFAGGLFTKEDLWPKRNEFTSKGQGVCPWQRQDWNPCWAGPLLWTPSLSHNSRSGTVKGPIPPSSVGPFCWCFECTVSTGLHCCTGWNSIPHY